VRTHIAASPVVTAMAALAVTATLAAGPALAAGPGRTAHPAFTNPGNASPSLSLTVTASGVPEVASVGKDGSLWFTDKSGGKWHRTEIAKSGAADSGPSILAVPDGGADLAVEGPSHSLQYYFLANGHWFHTQLAGKNTTFSAPSLTQGPEGLGIAIEGPNHTLWYYSTSADHWGKRQVGGNGVAFSAPSLVIRDTAQATTADPAGEVDIAVENSGNSLSFFHSLAGGLWQNDVISGPGTTFSAPSLVVVGGAPTRTPNQGHAIMAFEGPSHELSACVSASGCELLEGKNWDFSAPSLIEGDSYTWLPVAFQNSGHSLTVRYVDIATRFGQNAPVAGGLTTYSAPAIVLRSAHPVGQTDLVVQGHGNSLLYYSAPIPAPNKVLSFTKTTIAGPGTTFGG
jgi:hypothetical protein